MEANNNTLEIARILITNPAAWVKCDMPLTPDQLHTPSNHRKSKKKYTWLKLYENMTHVTHSDNLKLFVPGKDGYIEVIDFVGQLTRTAPSRIGNLFRMRVSSDEELTVSEIKSRYLTSEGIFTERKQTFQKHLKCEEIETPSASKKREIELEVSPTNSGDPSNDSSFSQVIVEPKSPRQPSMRSETPPRKTVKRTPISVEVLEPEEQDPSRKYRQLYYDNCRLKMSQFITQQLKQELSFDPKMANINLNVKITITEM